MNLFLAAVPAAVIVATPALSQKAAPAPSVPASLAPASSNATTLHIIGVQLRVSDIQRSLRFYTGILGLRVSRTFPKNSPATAYEILLSVTGRFDLTGTPFMSIKVAAHDGPSLSPEREGFGHLVLIVKDAARIAEHARSAGYIVVKQVPSLVMLADPDGYKVELIEAPPS
jgi:lactoylglutathione lyase